MNNKNPKLAISAIIPVLLLIAASLPSVAAKPDFSGVYDVATLTPFQRPKEFGDNLFLTKKQASAITDEAAAAAKERDRNLGPTKGAPPVGGAAPIGADEGARETSGAGNVGGYNNFWVDAGTDVFSVDGKFRTSIITEPKNGRMPSLTPQAMKIAMERRKFYKPNDGSAWWVNLEGAGHYDGPESLATSERCIIGFTGATPTFPSLYNNFKRIVQTPGHVMILLEMVHDARIVRMNSEHRPAALQHWLGDSIGWWEGDTLVVDTINFHPLSRQARGGSTNMHVIEKFSQMNDGNVLYSFTVDDPSVWAQAWSGEYVWRKSDDRVYEYACHEGNYSMEGILKGARILESEAPGVVESD